MIPRDVLLKLLKLPVNLFLSENVEMLSNEKLPYYHGLLVIDIYGEDSEGPVRHKGFFNTYSSPPNVKERLHLYEKLGTTHVLVALPSVVSSKMILKGLSPKGIVAPEVLNPEIFFKIMREHGYPINLQIQSTHEVQL